MLRNLLLALAGLASVVPFASAGDKYVRLVNVGTGKVLAVEGKSKDAESKLEVVKEDAGDLSQQWEVTKDGDALKLTNRLSGKVADVPGGSADEGTAIIQWDAKDDGADNQRWAWDGDGKGRRLKSRASGLVLDIGDNDKVVQKRTDDKSKAQLWEVVDVKPAR